MALTTLSGCLKALKAINAIKALKAAAILPSFRPERSVMET